ncbi:MAG: hypothetical protein U0W40_00515 [Acidimicrobiia bacterium]
MKRVLRAVTPPVIVDATRPLRTRASGPPAWELEPAGWGARDTARGWDVEGVTNAALGRLDEFRAALRGPAVLNMGTEAAFAVGQSPVGSQQEALVLAYALLRASRQREELSVLDWGGGLGFAGLIAGAVLGDVALDYHCREQPMICAAGRTAVPEVTFWDDDGCFDRSFDLVIASGSFQYAEDWPDLLATFAKVASDSVLITRLPVVERSPAFVVRQRVPQYDTDYLGWVLNRGELLQVAAGRGLEHEREFVLGYRPHVVGAPEQDEMRAYLFAVATTGRGRRRRSGWITAHGRNDVFEDPEVALPSGPGATSAAPRAGRCARRRRRRRAGAAAVGCTCSRCSRGGELPRLVDPPVVEERGPAGERALERLCVDDLDGVHVAPVDGLVVGLTCECGDWYRRHQHR